MIALLKYDGSFDGFLSCIFTIYEQKIKTPIIQKEGETGNQLFSKTLHIITEEEKAKRVWEKFTSLVSKTTQNKFFKVFLSEIKGVENTLYYFLKSTLDKNGDTSKDYGDQYILKISQVAKMVHREKHRMEAFVRFELTKDNIYMAVAEPDFNVLPLIIPHFKDRYADQQWMIYDIKRDYGVFYNLYTVEIIQADFFSKNKSKIASQHLAELELDFQKLWAQYYDSVNIKSRKNNKLHVQHLPKRYWKYLTEKKN